MPVKRKSATILTCLILATLFVGGVTQQSMDMMSYDTTQNTLINVDDNDGSDCENTPLTVGSVVKGSGEKILAEALLNGQGVDLKGLHFTRTMVAGIIGNFTVESGVTFARTEHRDYGAGDAKRVRMSNDEIDQWTAQGANGIGIAQWTWNPGRAKKLTDMARRMHKQWYEPEPQLQLIVDELAGPYRNSVYAPLSRDSTPSDAATTWLLHYEGVNNGTASQREAAAQAAYSRLSSQNMGSDVSTASDTSASSSADSMVDKYVQWALQHAEGAKTLYVWGGSGPKGYDCSHYVAAALQAAGLSGYQYAPTTSMSQALSMVGFSKVEWKGQGVNLRKGDILVSSTHTEIVAETPTDSSVSTVGAHTSNTNPTDQVSQVSHPESYWKSFTAWRLNGVSSTATTPANSSCGSVQAADMVAGSMSGLKTTGKGDTLTVDYRHMDGYAGYDGMVPTVGGYPAHQCTNWAYLRAKSLGYVSKYPGDWAHNGNGQNWVDSLVRKGFTKTTTPSAGDIVSFPGGVNGTSPGAGHVAVVEKVDSDGSMWLSEGGSGWYASYGGPVLHRYAQTLWQSLVAQGVRFAHPK